MKKAGVDSLEGLSYGGSKVGQASCLSAARRMVFDDPMRRLLALGVDSLAGL